MAEKRARAQEFAEGIIKIDKINTIAEGEMKNKIQSNVFKE